MARDNKLVGAKKPKRSGGTGKRPAKGVARDKGRAGANTGSEKPPHKTRSGIRGDKKPGKPSLRRRSGKPLPKAPKPGGRSDRGKNTRGVRGKEKVGRARPKSKAKPEAISRAKSRAKSTDALKPKAAFKAKSKSKPRAKPRAIPKAKPKAKPKAVFKAKPKAVFKAKPKPKAKSKAVFKAKPKPKAKSKAVFKAKPKPKARVKAKPKAVFKAKPKPKRKSKPKLRHPRDADGFFNIQLRSQGTIVDYLHTLAVRLRAVHPGFHYAVSDFANADGSVDGELKISGLQGDDWEKFFTLEGSMGIGRVLMQEVLAPMLDYWIATFMFFDTESFDSIAKMKARYESYQGALVQGTYYYSMDYGTMDKMIRAVVAITSGDRSASIPGFIETYGVSPSAIMVRMSWNPFNTNPLKYE